MKTYTYLALIIFIAATFFSACSGRKKIIKATPVGVQTPIAKVDTTIIALPLELQDNSLIVRVQVERMHRLKDDMFEMECKILDIKKTKTKPAFSPEDIIVFKPGYEYNGSKIAATEQNRSLQSLREFSTGGFIKMKVDYVDNNWTILEVLK